MVPDAGTQFDRSHEVGDLSSERSLLALRDVLNMISEVIPRVSDLLRTAETVATRSAVCTNTTGTIRVTASGGTISAVEFDTQWLCSARPDRIAEAVRDALTTSVRADAAAKEEVFGADPALNRLRRLTTSPEELLREIGLLR